MWVLKKEISSADRRIWAKSEEGWKRLKPEWREEGRWWRWWCEAASPLDDVRYFILFSYTHDSRKSILHSNLRSYDDVKPVLKTSLYIFPDQEFLLHAERSSAALFHSRLLHVRSLPHFFDHHHHLPEEKSWYKFQVSLYVSGHLSQLSIKLKTSIGVRVSLLLVEKLKWNI